MLLHSLVRIQFSPGGPMLPGNACLRDLRDWFVCEIKLTQMPRHTLYTTDGRRSASSFSGPGHKNTNLFTRCLLEGLIYKVASCTKFLCCQDTGRYSRFRTLAHLMPLMEIGKFSVFDVLFWWILKSLLGTLFLAAEAWSVVVTVGGGER